jgi:hypothetical protein
LSQRDNFVNRRLSPTPSAAARACARDSRLGARRVRAAFEVTRAGPCRLRSVPVCSPRPCRSGWLGFPAPSSTVHRLRCGPRGLPSLPRRRRHFWLRRDHLRGLRSRSAPRVRLGSARRSRGRGRPSSPGLHQIAPPSTCPAGVHSHRAPESSASATEAPPPPSRSVLVVSHHLDGLLHLLERGLVASRCRSWGSPRFPRRRLTASDPVKDRRSCPGRRVPRDAHTPRRSSLDPSRPASPRAGAPLALDRQRRLHVTADPHLRGFAPESRPVASTVVADGRRPLLPGLRPRRVHVAVHRGGV